MTESVVLLLPFVILSIITNVAIARSDATVLLTLGNEKLIECQEAPYVGGMKCERISERLRERGHVKLGVLQSRKPDLPANGCHLGFLEHQLANPLPMRT